MTVRGTSPAPGRIGARLEAYPSVPLPVSRQTGSSTSSAISKA